MNRLFKYVVDLVVDKRRAPYIINYLADKHSINLLLHAYRAIGIHKVDFEWSGEKNLIEHLLKEKLKEVNRPIIFDVGANIGKYTSLLHSHYPNALIHSFEPSKQTFSQLKHEIVKYSNVFAHNTALGSKKGEQTLFKPKNDFSSHSTLHSGVIDGLLNQSEVEEERVNIETLDSFCEKNEIKRIHFLKIDTEGHELEVLRGAEKLINSGAIDIIQFEFNEMNIISRTFLKDFYDLLTGYELNRVNTNNLVPLGGYNSINEIFQFQNILAIRTQ